MQWPRSWAVKGWPQHRHAVCSAVSNSRNPPCPSAPAALKPAEAGCGCQAPLLGTLWAAMIVWLVRLVAIFLGSWLGAYMGGSTVDHRRRIWQGMVTQVSRLCLHTASCPLQCTRQCAARSSNPGQAH